MWLATLPAEAQSSTPNYIAQAQAGVKKYYPEYEEYYKPIFTRTYKLSISSQNIINTKILYDGEPELDNYFVIEGNKMSVYDKGYGNDIDWLLTKQ